MTRLFISILNFIKTHRAYTVAGVLVCAVIVIAFIRFSGAENVTEATRPIRSVEMQTVAELMNEGQLLSIVGDVRSVSEAKVSTEASGRITRVYVSLGSTIGAGALLAEIENSAQRAALLQAEGALEAAQAAIPNLSSSLESARGTALTTLLTAYANVEGAIHDGVDPLLINPETTTPTFIVTTRDSQAKLTIENNRSSFDPILAREESIGTTLSINSDLVTELTHTEHEVRTARNYVDVVLKALNDGIVTSSVSEADLVAYKAAASAARASLTGSLAAIASARSTLEVAQNNVGTDSTVSTAGASLKQAEGAYNAAKAALERTRIRAPISGTVNNFSIELGDSVGIGQQVAVISNNRALEIYVYVTEVDRARMTVGDQVVIEGGLTGSITRIAPALDPETRKIEVRVGLSEATTRALVNGQSVRVSFITEGAQAESDTIRIPLTALKMEPNRTVVFSVNDENLLVAHEVHTGNLTGNMIEITGGLERDMLIVTDARGLKEGGVVNVFTE